MNNKKFIVSLLVALVVGLGLGSLVGVLSNKQEGSLGGGLVQVTRQQFVNGLSVGTGSTITNVLKGTCNLISDATVTATTSKAFDCAVTGAKSGDVVFASLNSATARTFGGWDIVSTKASTTDGYITVVVRNLTGADANPVVTGIGSSTEYLIIR